MISAAVQVNQDNPSKCFNSGAGQKTDKDIIIFAGVAADLSHINTNSTVTGYQPTPEGLREALSGAEIVLIPAGVPRKPGMTRDGMLQSSVRIS